MYMKLYNEIYIICDIRVHLQKYIETLIFCEILISVCTINFDIVFWQNNNNSIFDN